MTNRRMGEILYKLRTQQGVGQEQLCRGLCSKAALSRYELGERVPDRLLLNTLLQRLGKAADKMATILYIEEYQYLLWKKQVLLAVGREDMEGLRELLQKPQAVKVSINDTLQRQFYFQMQAILADRMEHDVEKSVSLLKDAVELTMPQFQFDRMRHYLISTAEMQILLNLSEQMIKGEQDQEACELLLEIAEYSWQHYNDKEALVKIYPKAVKLLMPLLLREKKYAHGLVLSERAIELLRWQGVLYDLAELMEGYLTCCENSVPGEHKVHYEKQLQALKEVYEEYGMDIYQSENSMLCYSNQEIYLVDEVIRMSRIDKSVSQEVLSENICTPETLSRIEGGRRAPNTRNFRALMEKLDVDQDYYNGKLDTEDFELLEKKRMLDRAISRKDWGEAEQLLNELKEKLDMRNPLNRKTMQSDENCILFNEGRLDAQKFLESCEQALGCGKEGWKNESFWKQFLTDYKIRLLNYIAAVYYRENEKKKSIYIWEHILTKLDDSKVDLSDRYSSSMIIVGNLSLYYGESGNFDKCVEKCDQGIHLCFINGRGVRIAQFIETKAEVMFLLGQKTACSKYLKQAYFLSDLMCNRDFTNYIKFFYRKCYGVELSDSSLNTQPN